MPAKKSKLPTVSDTFDTIARLLSPSFKKFDKEAKAIAKRLALRRIEFKEAEERVERKLRSGIRKTKGDAV